MKKLYIASILFYTFVILNFVYFDIPSQFTAILALVSFFISLIFFVVLLSLEVSIFFDKKFKPLKSYINVNVTFYSITFFICVIFKVELYNLFSNTILFYSIALLSLAVSMYCFWKKFKFIEKNKYTVTSSVFSFLKFGAELEGTKMFKAVGVLDRYFYLFALVSVIVENVYIFLSIVAVIIILAFKSNKVVYDWMKENFSNSRTAVITLISFYISYILAACVWCFMENQLLVILVASLSIVLTKLNYNKILVSQES